VIGYATYQRTAHRMTSRSKRLPLNSIITCSPPKPLTANVHQADRSAKLRQNRSECVASHLKHLDLHPTSYTCWREC
jgi:hypothetical protein